MKTWLLALTASLGLATAAAADPLIGWWQTEPDDGSYALVQIEPCGPAFCGVIRRTYDATGEYQSPNLGKQIVMDMVAEGEGHYEGRVWRPSNDKVYIGKMDISGNQVKLRGCVAGGLFCASQTWTRVN